MILRPLANFGLPQARDLVLHELYRRLLGTRDAVAAGRLLRLVEDAVAASLDVVGPVAVGGAVRLALGVTVPSTERYGILRQWPRTSRCAPSAAGGTPDSDGG